MDSLYLTGKTDSFYPMYFGVSCAFFALKVLSKPEKEDDKWIELCDKMLKGSTQLLGLLVWRIQSEKANDAHRELVQKLETAEKEIKELKQIRREDAKANEKVVGIFASQEQSWFMERNKLRQHIGALMNQLRILQRQKAEAVCELDNKLKEMELLFKSTEKALQEEEHKRKELEEKLAKADFIAEELRETAKREAQEYSTDLWKHKTAFLELVSNQRQLEAELGRALRQLDAKSEEIDLVLEQKEESVLLAEKLSMEVVKMRNDLEQKDKVLSAMLRKSKLDTAEKQMLLKEVKLSKAKRKQAEQATERWRAVSECKHERNSLRNMFAHHGNSRSDDPSIVRGTSQGGKGRSKPTDYVLEYENPEFRKESEALTPMSDFYSPKMNDELAITANVKSLEGWVRTEAEKYVATIEKRHHLEIDAFAEQMRLKDEKLEALRWRMLSMEIESKRLQSHFEGLNKNLSQVRQQNMKLEALLSGRQEELYSFKFEGQVKPQILRDLPDPALEASSIQIVKRETSEMGQETHADLVEMSEENDADKEQAAVTNSQIKNVVFNVQSPEKEFEEEKDIPDQTPPKEKSTSTVEVETVEKLPSPSQPLIKTNNSPLRMDLQALGVSYKIKRLKQQVVMLERLTGKQESGETAEIDDGTQNEIKGFQVLLSLLSKQISRYQSLQSKTDELCKRMHDNDVNIITHGESSTVKTKEETKTLEHFLDETFQLQRYMVATGQKLMEVQSKISSGFVGVTEELDKSVSFDTQRFADNMRTLFQEVQRGLEVRISRIIGDLEGTLACQGMIRLRK